MSEVKIKDTYVSKYPEEEEDEDNRCYYNNGVTDPIAIVQSSHGNHWEFTKSLRKITESDQVIYGRTSEEMVESLERYLDLPRHSDQVEFIQVSKGSKGPISIYILPHPKLKLERREDILNHLGFVDKHNSIQFTLPSSVDICNNDVQQSLEHLLEPRGYVIDGNLVRKNRRLATQRKKRREKSDKMFKVYDIAETVRDIEKLLVIGDDVYITSERQTGLQWMARLLVSLSIIERVYGKNSRRRVIPFQKMIKKWKDADAFTKPFHSDEFKDYQEWLGKEASKRKSRGTPIESVNVIDCMLT